MKFYITFGQQYRHEPHPQGGHPDGWFTINAPNRQAARDGAFDVLDVKWAFIYDEAEFEHDMHFYPKGCLKEL